MAKYIEREATIKLLRSLGSRDYRREKGTIQEAIKMVSFPEYTPSADVAPVRHGHWSEADDDGEYTCSHCGWVGRITCLGKDKIGSSDIDYCPYCGAKMDEVIE